MARTWSNAKRPPALSPAPPAKKGPHLYHLLLVVTAIWFFGLIAYTMVHVTLHPITELPHTHVQDPKED